MTKKQNYTFLHVPIHVWKDTSLKTKEKTTRVEDLGTGEGTRRTVVLFEVSMLYLYNFNFSIYTVFQNGKRYL